MKLSQSYRFFFVAFIFLTICSPGNIWAEEFDFDAFTSNLGEKELTNLAAQARAKAAETPFQSEVDKIVKDLDGVNLFQKDLYKKTNLVMSRSVHDMPLFMQTNASKRCDYCFGVEVDPFYNQTTHMFFADSSSNLKSYVDFSMNGLLGTLINKVAAVKPELNVKADQILPLFSDMTLQEHRAGLYIRLSAYLRQWTLQFAVPLCYQERNFFMTQEQRNNINNAPFLSSQTTGMGDTDVENMMMKHLVSDKIGFGDMRFHALYTPFEDECTRCTLGAFVTLPTAFAFKNGLLGGSFYKHNYNGIPPFSIRQPLALLTNPDLPLPGEFGAIVESGKNYGLRALDQLTAILAETSLGNNGHVGIAPVCEYAHRLVQCDNYAWGILAQASFQAFLPANEKRAYLVKNVPSDFIRNYNPNPPSEAIALQNLNFFDQQINDILFPTIIDTKITPGCIFDFNAAFNYTYSDTVKAQLGYDLWWRGNENIAMSSKLTGAYDIGASKMASALQQKIFGSIETTFSLCGGDLTTRFGGDYAVASDGIGRDFNLDVLLQLSY